MSADPVNIIKVWEPINTFREYGELEEKDEKKEKKEKVVIVDEKEEEKEEKEEKEKTIYNSFFGGKIFGGYLAIILNQAIKLLVSNNITTIEDLRKANYKKILQSADFGFNNTNKDEFYGLIDKKLKEIRKN